MRAHANRALALCGLALFPVMSMADWTMNMSPGVTQTSNDIYGLHMTILWICVVIGVVVFGVMFWSIFAHRKSRGHKPANFHENTTVEVLWTIIPLVILVAMAIPATVTLIDMYDTTEADVDIKITGYQWKWKYDYLDDEFGYFSSLSTPRDQINNRQAKGENYLLEVDKPLVVPVGQKVRLLMTANDVIHSWWVPEFGLKKDAIPGFINEAWIRVDTPGTYRGQCTELCGKDHGFMPIVVEAVPQAEYQIWVGEQRAAAEKEKELTQKEWTMADLMERGEQSYQSACAACHQADGSGLPPSFPALRGSAIAVGDIAGHIDIVVNGKRGTAMQAFGEQLNEVDIAAIITYERNAWGNNVGDMVTPKEIFDYKSQQQQ
ncbi:cytochrome c oxidase subunit II [Marinobacter sp. M3C]|jgi:cytochrome c oxidase subunit 2|uniref:cytochrome c oxidase subunit II n=1 Tax=unclassified Marinobacter TaxID=83889 RepID=UPI00200D2835|nr:MULTISPECIES: cytochrome c oxidase subunit II [unclassified Marinobacter]MCL1476608.1 cytochrome c oxidase subunit II [Marinobacter sp.]MCL1481204.1 cytochrome c oxidase subunit II [Marinobacter sp.]MCL1484678.1 cytochrome c oxidase subunit II [Marinobacter sp.]MCL1487931.1 cytochrome c oxidase subunit II [Marinobacter sp.]UQG56160.1 cytochrome c oxidase subunit II [Marinobacter sp. M4C]